MLSCIATTLILELFIPQADFPICQATGSQYYPSSIWQNNQFYCFWNDRRFAANYCVYGARITETGTVIDPDGKQLFSNQADAKPEVAWDGSNFLVVFRDSC
ncbi:hypothetical protein JXB22_10635 [candidate division WOR-3 bacterium]|nr:hypothetical protein [candidate division WOR-3 bacterium]